jgi:acetoacetate decarboxylase
MKDSPMTENEVKARAFAMPLTSPAFARPPYRFVNREYLIVTYRTDPAALGALIPAPLEMAEPIVKYEFIRMPDSTGFGDYTESGQVLPVNYRGSEDVMVKGAWEGPAALELFHHALAPVAQLPVLEVLSGVHILCDLTLGLGSVVHDYLKERTTA